MKVNKTIEPGEVLIFRSYENHRWMLIPTTTWLSENTYFNVGFGFHINVNFFQTERFQTKSCQTDKLDKLGPFFFLAYLIGLAWYFTMTSSGGRCIRQYGQLGWAPAEILAHPIDRFGCATKHRSRGGQTD